MINRFCMWHTSSHEVENRVGLEMYVFEAEEDANRNRSSN